MDSFGNLAANLLERCTGTGKERAAQLEKLYFENAKKLKDVRNLESAEICQKADIVGLTTTGAAKQRALLNHLKPKIVVVEEAAEVLESHVVCALSTSCQQLVLIGDHQQLRPPVTVYKLAKDYFLDVSLFERLIKNGMEPCVLGVQHRMRPEIARLIVPSIYPTLENHSSVLEYPDVRGMASNVFFLAHTEQEVEDNEGKSHLNPYEVDLSLALARHLIMQGYTPEQITILTTYSGQLLHFFKVRRSHSAVQSVRISVVDNFQGEENDIIILSLVRSNVDENIGFLRIENRICVALSRAKHGFYMIGNMQNLQGKSRLWNGISRILDNDGQIGPDFGLRCDVHGVVTQAHKVTDFPPEGGCMNKCSSKMPCGHICPKMCHADDRDHALVKCQELCTRFCPVGHPCPKKCFAVCNPCVKRMIPECGHEVDLPCSTEPTRALCKKMCASELPCGHLCKKKCCEPCNQADCVEPLTTIKVNLCGHHVTLSCKDFHEATLDCEHLCKGTCGECFNGRVHRACDEKCGRSLVCGHICNVNCGISCPPCGLKCQYSCSHSKCGHKCCEPCTPCKEKCPWSCQHKTCTKKCGDPCNRSRCDEPCKKTLPCGHFCAGLCGEICPPLCRVCDKEKLTEFIMLGNEDEEDAKFVFLPDCGHCIEVEAMDKWMDTDGGGQIQQKCCPRCKTPIKVCMRYGDIIKNVYGDIAKAKMKIFQSKGNPLEFSNHCSAKLTRCRKIVRKCEELVNSTLGAINKNLDAIEQQRVRISTREYQAASRELDRFEYVRAYFVLQSTPSFPVLGASSPENELIQRLLMKNIRVLENEQKVELRAAMETLGVKLKTGLGITDKERREIVQALGMGQGHWFKCPNGHIYAIGDCGGASVESRCNECQARIGGTGHRLLGDNRLAGEMDGAARPAWPQ
ncbi:hypothetical protein DAPPUDRAFT_129702 [Daphnia pulex]|uniref:RZ-type domain-containing protein n=1 Tax=Daphnia pulex TaxID=6669 RepID=E9HA13_DAPPU|nr:hypothetical protein DAPPUDRAFT_129702 [Daphnia pulex]|eukprot:EFX71347.1 hypothetical protein DAPPUDRAFT_129702 [Daphnia pulex]